MYKGKHSKIAGTSKFWLITIILLIVIVFIIAFAIAQPWKSMQSEETPAVSEDASEETIVDFEQNTFFQDLSCSGTITDIDGSICFVSDHMYSVEIDGTIYEDVNFFRLNDSNYQKWAEQSVIIRASTVAYSGNEFTLDLQYLVGDDVCVSTPFSEYHFPSEWADRLIVAYSYSDLFYKVDFYADMHEAQEYLFSIVMGEAEGMPIGKLTDSMDGVTMVYLMEREDDFSAYSQADQTYLYSMMEGINYLLDKLYENPQFSDEF